MEKILNFIFLFFVLATVRCRSLEKRSAEVGRTVNQAFNQGSSNPSNNGFFQSSGSPDPFDNYFFNSFKQQSGKKKRSAKADPQFHQTYNAGSNSVNYDCKGPFGCGSNVPAFTFHTPQSVTNNGATFDQEYNAQSSATNLSYGKKKRSAKADAKPGFVQTYQAGSHS